MQGFFPAQRLGFLIFFVYILAIVFILSCFFLMHSLVYAPLRTSISRYLRHFLQDLNIKSEALEQIVQLVTNDNLDLGCAAIEQAATEKVCVKFYIIYVPAFKLVNLKITRIYLEWIASTSLD